MKNRKRKGWIENIIGMLFILVLFLFMFINLAVPDREMSEKENRMLETRPALSMSTVLDGEFMEQWENYQSDQFAGRDFWRSVKVFLDRLGGSKMENGVYIGKSGQLLEEIEVPDDGQSEANLSAIVDFAEKYPEHLIELLQKSEITTIAVDALGIAEECGSAKAVNVVLLGVLASKLTEIPQSVWYESLKSVIPAKLYEINEKAFQKGLSV